MRQPEVLWVVVDSNGNLHEKPRKSEFAAKQLISRLNYHARLLQPLRVVAYVPRDPLKASDGEGQ